MKQLPKFITLLAIVFMKCSGDDLANRITGTWDNTKNVEYSFDTIRQTEDLDKRQSIYTIKTDSGTFNTIYSFENPDSLLGVEIYKIQEVINFHFDDKNHGISTLYQLDTNFIAPISSDFNEDPRWTAGQHYNFKLFRKNGSNYLIFDYGFSQFGRSFDTVEINLISNDQLLILNRTDTLRKIKNEP